MKIGAIVDRLRSTPVPMLDEVLREGLRGWWDAGFDPQAYLDAQVVYREPTGEERVTIVPNGVRFPRLCSIARLSHSSSTRTLTVPSASMSIRYPS